MGGEPWTPEEEEVIEELVNEVDNRDRKLTNAAVGRLANRIKVDSNDPRSKHLNPDRDYNKETLRCRKYDKKRRPRTGKLSPKRMMDGMWENHGRLEAELEFDFSGGGGEMGMMGSGSEMGTGMGMSGQRALPAPQQTYSPAKPQSQNIPGTSGTPKSQAADGDGARMDGLMMEVNELSMSGLPRERERYYVPEQKLTATFGSKPTDNTARSAQMAMRGEKRRLGIKVPKRYEKKQQANAPTQAGPSTSQGQRDPGRNATEPQQQQPYTRQAELDPSIPAPVLPFCLPAGLMSSQNARSPAMRRPGTPPHGGRHQRQRGTFDPQQPLQPQHQPSMSPIPPPPLASRPVPAQPYIQPPNPSMQQPHMPNQPPPTFANTNRLAPLVNVLPPIQVQTQEHPNQHRQTMPEHEEGPLVHQAIGKGGRLQSIMKPKR